MYSMGRLSILLCSGLLFASCLQNQSEEEPTAAFRAQIVSNGGQFNGKTWNGGTWNGQTWNGGTWNGQTWNGNTWNGGTWNGSTWNGGTWNGGTWNGSNWNGGTWNGSTWNGDGWYGTTANGQNFGEFSIEDSQLFVHPAKGVKIGGMNLIGSTAVAHIHGSNTEVTLRIDNVMQDTSRIANDVWSYSISYRTNSSQTFQSVCVDHSGAPTTGVFLSHAYWDESTGNRVDQKGSFTFACADGVLAKCAHAGYRPWASATICKKSYKEKDRDCSSVSLKDYHQACTRMLRADYCGDGKAWTLDGTLIDIFDYLDPPIQLREEKWTFEARWQPTGAMCVSRERHPELGFGGKCKDSKGRERTMRFCNPYEEDKGLIVSTFNGSGPTGIKGK